MKSAIKYISAVALTIILWSCSKSEESTQRLGTKAVAQDSTVVLSAQQAQTIGVTTTKITRRALSGVVRVTGQLDVPPQNLVSVSAPFGGFLKTTEMLQGKKVRRGEVIAVIENPEYIQMQQDYLDLSSQLEFATAELQRQEELAKENVNAKKTLQQATSTRQSLSAKTSGLAARLKLINLDADKLTANRQLQSTINLYAPIHGYVTEINANIGKYVSPTDVIMKIVDSEHLHAELVVFEKDVLKLKIGQKVRFVLANETKSRTATIYLIGREITSQRTVRVHCHLDDEDPNLLPGMFLSADVETGSEQTNVLPSGAIVDFSGSKYVFVVEPGKPNTFKMQPVVVGPTQDGYSEVSFSGISESMLFVDQGSFELLSVLKNSDGEDDDH